MTDKTLATFRIETEQWKAFQAKAGNASTVLKDFVAAYLDGRVDIKPDGSIDTLANLDSKIEAILDERLGKLEKKSQGLTLTSRH